MTGARAAIAVLAALLCAAAPAGANLLEGHYQITSLMYIQDNDGRQRGFNNTALYIVAEGKRIRVVGAFRGYPVAHNLIVDKTIGDTLVLREAGSTPSVYKFHIRNNVVSGRHAIKFDDGTRNVIDAKATIRKLNRGEVDRLRPILGF